jgi:Flp pilus assembly protein TadB
MVLLACAALLAVAVLVWRAGAAARERRRLLELRDGIAASRAELAKASAELDAVNEDLERKFREAQEKLDRLKRDAP